MVNQAFFRRAVIASAIVTFRRRTLSLYVLGTSFACVPTESADPPGQQVDQVYSRPALTHFRPRPSPQSTVVPGRVPDADVDPARDPIIDDTFTDDFNRDSLGTDWLPTNDRWQLRSGRICGQSARNHPLWLKKRLPENARITYTARSLSEGGDIKVEAWGSGRSYARGQSYNDATSYVFIFGGWKNRLHVLARLDEHGKDRKTLSLVEGKTDPTESPVVPNRDYHFVIQRSNGRTISWEVEGTQLFAFEDAVPLKGVRHDHFAFNNWETGVCFDDLVVLPLE